MRIPRGFFVILPLALASCSASSASSSPADEAPQTTLTRTIGPEGGTMDVEGATIAFPAGALAEPRAITISTTAVVPEGFVAVSKVWKCEPSGTAFDAPVTMTMPFKDDGKGPLTMFWSAGQDPTFADVGGKAEGDRMTTTIRHFSSGFVGRKN
jgi:hypothetical protein